VVSRSPDRVADVGDVEHPRGESHAGRIDREPDRRRERSEGRRRPDVLGLLTRGRAGDGSHHWTGSVVAALTARRVNSQLPTSNFQQSLEPGAWSLEPRAWSLEPEGPSVRRGLLRGFL